MTQYQERESTIQEPGIIAFPIQMPGNAKNDGPGEEIARFPVYREELNEAFSRFLFGKCPVPPDGTDVSIFKNEEEWLIEYSIAPAGHQFFPTWEKAWREENNDERSFDELLQSEEWREFKASQPLSLYRRKIERKVAFELCYRSMMPSIFAADMDLTRYLRETERPSHKSDSNSPGVVIRTLIPGTDWKRLKAIARLRRVPVATILEEAIDQYNAGSQKSMPAPPNNR